MRYKKPIIGINIDIVHDSPQMGCIQSPYFEAIEKSGGVPILLPPMSQASLEIAVSLLDGLMLIGGLDYTLSQYEKEPSAEEIAKFKTVSMHTTREDADFKIIAAAFKKNIPILGICAGHQLLNIALGGTLNKDIEVTNTTHRSPNGWKDGFHKHEVALEMDAKLYWMYPHKTFKIVSSHHQCIDKLGEGLRPAAYAPDGVIEAVELPNYPFCVGVQWHPERDYANNCNLFNSFIGACGV